VTDDLIRALRLRRAVSQAATKKYAALIERQVDGRIYDNVQYRGAQRTGRWSGRGFQLQNLKRPAPGTLPWVVAEAAKSPYLYNLLYGGDHALETLGGAIRGAVHASPGKLLVVSDLSNIEPRRLAHITQDPALLRIFRQGMDCYKAFAGPWLGIPYNDVDKQTRNDCKPPFLGCGYGLGEVGLESYAYSMGIDLDADACSSAVSAFRRTYSGVKRYWKRTEADCKMAILTGGRHGKWEREGEFVTLRLDSGRKLYYFNPSVEDGEIRYWGRYQDTTNWAHLYTWGGKLLENEDQALACDDLAYGMRLYTEHGGTIVGHIHDEAIAEEDEANAEQALELLNWCLTQPPPWGCSVPLEAEGYISPGYKKG